MGNAVTNPSNAAISTKTIAGWSSIDFPAGMQLKSPETATVERKRVARQGNRYVLIDLEPRTGIIVSQPERPSKFTNVVRGMGAVEAIESLMAKKEAWTEGRDEDIHDAMLKAAQVSMLDGEACRRLSRVVSGALECRAGLSAPDAFNAV